MGKGIISGRAYFMLGTVAVIRMVSESEKLGLTKIIRVAINLSQSSKKYGLEFYCVNVPLRTSFGSTNSTLEYCTFSSHAYFRNEVRPFLFKIEFHYDGGFIWRIQQEQNLSGFYSIFVWKDNDGRSMHSMESDSIMPKHFLYALVHLARLLVRNCELISTKPIEPGNGIINGITGEVNKECQFKLDIRSATEMVFFLRLIFAIEKVDERQRRYEVSWRKLVAECPIQVSSIRPLVDILPLLFTSVSLFVVNILVSMLVPIRGKFTKPWYLIVKEVLGYESMSNALEDSKRVSTGVNLVPMERVMRDGLTGWQTRVSMSTSVPGCHSQ